MLQIAGTVVSIVIDWTERVGLSPFAQYSRKPSAVHATDALPTLPSRQVRNLRVHPRARRRQEGRFEDG